MQASPCLCRLVCWVLSLAQLCRVAQAACYLSSAIMVLVVAKCGEFGTKFEGAHEAEQGLARHDHTDAYFPA